MTSLIKDLKTVLQVYRGCGTYAVIEMVLESTPREEYCGICSGAPTRMKTSTTSKFPPIPVFIGLTVASLLIWYRALWKTVSLAVADDRYTHILLILPISAVLIYRQWKQYREQARPSFSYALLLLVVFVLAGAARWQSWDTTSNLRVTLNMLALVTWWLASLALCFGARAFRAFLLPLLFLYWLVPLPLGILTRMVTGLQWGSAWVSELLFKMSATPVSLDGLVLGLPDLELEVAPECSSIRSSLILIVTAMMLAQILLRSPWRKLLVVAVAIPLSIAKNGLRIFAIGWLTIHVDPAFLEGRLHREGGIIFFAVALAAIFVLLWILYGGEKKLRTD
jgi:exosortase